MFCLLFFYNWLIIKYGKFLVYCGQGCNFCLWDLFPVRKLHRYKRRCICFTYYFRTFGIDNLLSGSKVTHFFGVCCFYCFTKSDKTRKVHKLKNMFLPIIKVVIFFRKICVRYSGPFFTQNIKRTTHETLL